MKNQNNSTTKWPISENAPYFSHLRSANGEPDMDATLKSIFGYLALHRKLIASTIDICALVALYLDLFPQEPVFSETENFAYYITVELEDLIFYLSKAPASDSLNRLEAQETFACIQMRALAANGEAYHRALLHALLEHWPLVRTHLQTYNILMAIASDQSGACNDENTRRRLVEALDKLPVEWTW